MTELLDLHRRTLAYAVSITDLIEPGDLPAPTPCAGWDVDRLLAHIAGQNRGFAAAARGSDFDHRSWAETPASPAEVAASADLVAAAFAEADLERRWSLLAGVDTEVPVPGRTAVGFHFIDNVVHAWDVAAAIGRPVEFDDEVLEAVLPLAVEVPVDGPTREGAHAPFAPPVDAGGGRLARLLARLGRDPSWSPA